MKSPTEYSRILDAAFSTIPPVLQLTFDHPSVCIAGCWITKEALDYFAIDAKPVAVNVIAMNQKGLNLMEQGVPHDEWPKDAWSVGVHEHQSRDDPRFNPMHGDDNGWNGHLVLAVPALELVVDMTSYQMSRPERELIVEPVGFPLADDFLEGPGVEFENPHGVRMVYQAAPDNRGWQSSPDWAQGERRYSNVAGHVIRLMTRLLQEGEKGQST